MVIIHFYICINMLLMVSNGIIREMIVVVFM